MQNGSKLRAVVKWNGRNRFRETRRNSHRGSHFRHKVASFCASADRRFLSTQCFVSWPIEIYARFALPQAIDGSMQKAIHPFVAEISVNLTCLASPCSVPLTSILNRDRTHLQFSLAESTPMIQHNSRATFSGGKAIHKVNGAA
jgi:hypothetical protein